MPLAREVEVGVLRQVDMRRLVGRRAVFDGELVARRQRVGDRCAQGARVAFLAIAAHVREGDADVAAALERLRAPHHLVEPLVAAVQVVVAIVGREVEVAAVDREAPFRDAVAVAADDGAEVARPCEVALEVVESQRDVAEAARAIARADRHQDRAVRDRAHLRAVHVRQREDLDGGAVRRGAERRARDRRGQHDDGDGGGCCCRHRVTA